IMQVLCIILILPSCKKAGLFEKVGGLLTEARALPEYTEVLLYDKVDVVLKYDTVESLSVTCGENLLAGIETAVKNGQLTIRDNNNFKWSRDLAARARVLITGRRLNKISYYGAGNITSVNQWKSPSFIIDSYEGVGSFNVNMDTDHMTLIIRKANADFMVTGRARHVTSYIADHGSMDLTNFSTETMGLDYRSIRRSVINVKNDLQIKIHYTGNVYYYGDPQIRFDSYNTGTLIKAG
ncbi:MAG: hypothetical protein EOO04_31385, partial [Chitinophagaceae bacterium]